ncbi:MAG: hypothetical protein LEGION0398_MBIBDBAK_01254 [Legionellaceae bacterium]
MNMTNRYVNVLSDFVKAIHHWRIWVLLGWQDIQLRYRRSMIGPFWITLSIIITIYSMGFLYGHLFKMDLKTYFPYLAAGFISWVLISSLIIDGTDVFIMSDTYIKQINLPLFCFVFRAIFRNIIIFLHNILAFIPLIFIYHVPINSKLLLIIPGLILIAINAASYCTILAIIGARFRDIAQIIASLVQVIFFVTPIMWTPQLLPEKYQFVVKYNPLAQFIELIRKPLLGQIVTLNTLIVTCALTLVGLVLMILLFARCRSRVVYWL